MLAQELKELVLTVQQNKCEGQTIEIKKAAGGTLALPPILSTLM